MKNGKIGFRITITYRFYITCWLPDMTSWFLEPIYLAVGEKIKDKQPSLFHRTQRSRRGSKNAFRGRTEVLEVCGEWKETTFAAPGDIKEDTYGINDLQPG